MLGEPASGHHSHRSSAEGVMPKSVGDGRRRTGLSKERPRAVGNDQFPAACFMNLSAVVTVGSFARITLSISEMWLSRGT